ncbi:MAG: hypothetical protein DWQ36_21230 [Acidobacteria bacterium]|nr:MAG: hypothetical protein DWQ30_09820 [Acidobacteriota bacterium]REK01034.1 MAG: hypothetical protein DWQ36_21230 [Acidobacteriota bacterium]
MDPRQRIDLGFDPEDLELLVDQPMPYGRYRGRALIDLPEEYLMALESYGWPEGELGRLLALTLGIKRHGAEHVVKDLRRL